MAIYALLALKDVGKEGCGRPVWEYFELSRMHISLGENEQQMMVCLALSCDPAQRAAVLHRHIPAAMDNCRAAAVVALVSTLCSRPSCPGAPIPGGRVIRVIWSTQQWVFHDPFPSSWGCGGCCCQGLQLGPRGIITDLELMQIVRLIATIAFRLIATIGFCAI